MANPTKRGFFRSAMDAMVAAREREVSRHINSALLMLDDATLKANGYTREELRKRGSSGFML